MAFICRAFFTEELLANARQENEEQFSKLFPLFQESSVGSKLTVPSTEVLKKSAIQIWYTMRLLKRYPDLSTFKILEIGGGFGNLARIFLLFGVCQRYHIADISVIHSIQQYYLQNSLNKEDLGKLTLFDVENDEQYQEIQKNTYDLVISTFALTECPTAIQRKYVENFISRAKYIYIVGQCNFKGENIYQPLISCLEEYFDLEINDYKYYVPDRPAFELFGKNYKLEASM